MKYIYFIIISALFASCSSVEKENLTESIYSNIDLSDSLKINEQISSIYNVKDTTLILQGGVKVFIPKQAFVDRNDKIIDSVEIRFLECLTKESMLIENLSTTSDSALLISNGMLKIEAFKGLNLLKLKKGKELKVYFPKNDKQEEFNLFYGDRNNNDSIINWVIAPKKVENKQNKRITPKYIDKINYTGYTSKIGNFVPTYNFQNLKIKDNFFEYFVSKFKPSKKAMKWFASNYQLIGSSDSVGFHITINYNKDLTVNEIIYSDKKCLFVSELDFFLKSMPKVRYETVRNYDLDMPELKFTIYASQEFDQEDYNRQVEVNRKKGILNNDDLNNFVYSVSNLGWINCDRFYEYTNTFNLFVFDKNKNELHYNLVFKSFNSIMKPFTKDSNMVFTKIPKNERVELIGYKFLGDSVLYSSKEFVTTQDMFEIKNVNVISFDNFKSKLKKLNN